jgi:4-hydroxy-tetrahydrodipicolinate synthase
VHGLYPNGSTGEFLRFTVEERRRIVEIMADQTAGRVPILAGAAEANARETILACEHYYKVGCRAVAIVSPFYYKLSPPAVYAYFAEIARHSPIDITLYNIPLFASPIDVPTVTRLAAEFPRVVAIKDSSGDLPHMMRMIAAVRPDRPEFSFLTGWDAAIVPMMMMGCDGGTNATSGIVPELTRKLYDLALAGRYDVAAVLQYQLLELFDAMFGSLDFPEGFRAAVKIRGFRMGVGRHPLSTGQQVDLESLTRRLRCLLAENGVPDVVAGECPATPNAPGKEVDQIVAEVLGRLRDRGVLS